jgi:hypothetical protein
LGETGGGVVGWHGRRFQGSEAIAETHLGFAYQGRIKQVGGGGKARDELGPAENSALVLQILDKL